MRVEACARCANYGDERIKGKDDAIWSTCRIGGPELLVAEPKQAEVAAAPNLITPGRFPWMPRNGWCRRYEQAPPGAATEVALGPPSLED